MPDEVTAPEEPAPRRPRIPEEVRGIQVNHCKNPSCRNFGIPALVHAHRGEDENYALAGLADRKSAIRCKHCNEYPPVKSNLGVFEETARALKDHVRLDDEPCCPTPGCANQEVPVGTPKAYHRWSATATSPRWRCLKCGTRFTVPVRTTLRQKRCELNPYILRSLIAKTPMRKIAFTYRVSPQRIYDRLAFFAEQCARFSAAQEQQLLDGRVRLPPVRLQTDHQDFIFNWPSAGDTRNIQLRAITSCEAASGYAFGGQLDFDSSLDRAAIEKAAVDAGDTLPTTPYAMRRYARLWLNQDYEEAAAKAEKRAAKRQVQNQRRGRNVVLRDVAERYRAADPSDVEDVSSHDDDSQLPPSGMQVKGEYLAYGHFFFLATLLAGAERVDFNLDQDSTLRAGYMAAFADRIKAGASDAFYVYINKDYFKNTEREDIVGESYKEVRRREKREPWKSREQVQRDMIIEAAARMAEIGRWKDKWLPHPLPSKTEPEKSVCRMTEGVIGRAPYDEDFLAEMYRVASLQTISRYQMQIRRGISVLERPIETTAGRVWYGNAPYNPARVAQLLTIFRVHHNWCQIGEDKQTPAMRLGLADRPYLEEEIIDFLPPTEATMRLAA